MTIGILLLRLVVGLTLAAHGAQKLFGWFGGHGLKSTGAWLESVGFRPGRRHAVMAGLIEFGGGLLLAAGFLTPLASVMAASVMIVAAATAHAGKGFFLSGGGYEYNLVLGVAGLVPAFSGPGAFSIDALLGLDLQGPVCGIAAAVLAIAIAAIQLATRQVGAPTRNRTAA
jgi:putative oxidoreductase